MLAIEVVYRWSLYQQRKSPLRYPQHCWHTSMPSAICSGLMIALDVCFNMIIRASISENSFFLSNFYFFIGVYVWRTHIRHIFILALCDLVAYFAIYLPLFTTLKMIFWFLEYSTRCTQIVQGINCITHATWFLIIYKFVGWYIRVISLSLAARPLGMLGVRLLYDLWNFICLTAS